MLRRAVRGFCDIAKLGEPRMSSCLLVDSAIKRIQQLRQIRGIHPGPSDTSIKLLNIGRDVSRP